MGSITHTQTVLGLRGKAKDDMRLSGGARLYRSLHQAARLRAGWSVKCLSPPLTARRSASPLDGSKSCFQPGDQASLPFLASVKPDEILSLGVSVSASAISDNYASIIPAAEFLDGKSVSISGGGDFPTF